MKEKKFYPNYFTYPAIIVFTIFYCIPIIASLQEQRLFYLNK